jgi:hypothetical protein
VRAARLRRLAAAVVLVAGLMLLHVTAAPGDRGIPEQIIDTREGP